MPAALGQGEGMWAGHPPGGDGPSLALFRSLEALCKPILSCL